MGNCEQLRKYHGCVTSFTFRICSRISAPVCDHAMPETTTREEVKYVVTTTSMSEHEHMEAHFIGEWSKMINTIENAFNDIFAGFGAFHG